jgi:dTDP-4-dehydrorhamnose 3,5-epimerase
MTKLKNIKIIKMKSFKNNKGNVLRAFRKNEKNIGNFGEVYFSWINKNKIKGWKLHKKMHMNLVVPVGLVKFVFCENNKFKEFVIGEKNYYRIYVPNQIYFAFQNLSKTKSLVVNYSNIIHQNANETINKNNKEISYQWKK